MKSLVLALLFVSISAFATNVTVDCTGATPGAFTSINTAIGTLDSIGPHTVFVSGTCIENVFVTSHDRVTLQGSPTATIQSPAGGIALRIDRSRGASVMGLTLTGGNRALYVQRNSDASVAGVTIENAVIGILVDDGGIVSLGGPAGPQAVLIRNNGTGVQLSDATLRASGNVTVENNSGAGIDAAGSRLAFNGTPAGPNIIRTNGGNGVFAHAGSDVDFGGANQITGNTLTGLLAFENATVDLLGSPTQFTLVDGNQRGGLVWIFNASGRLQNVVVSNNGTAGNALSSGVTVASNSSAILNSSTITGTTGPGAVIDSGGMARFNGTTISGGTAEPVRVVTGGILELQTGNTITGVGNDVVVCDDSAVLFGDGANVSTSCKKTK